jgi:hypothetical protein
MAVEIHVRDGLLAARLLTGRKLKSVEEVE